MGEDRIPKEVFNVKR